MTPLCRSAISNIKYQKKNKQKKNLILEYIKAAQIHQIINHRKERAASVNEEDFRTMRCYKGVHAVGKITETDR